MDGERLADEELNSLKKMHAEDPDRLINPEELARIQSGLKATYVTGKDIPNASKFQTSLFEKLKQEQVVEPMTTHQPDNVSSFPAQQAKSKNWLLTGAAMAACFLLGLLVNLAFLNKNNSNSSDFVNVTDQPAHLQPVVYSAYENLSADYLSADDTNVIIIEGLDAIPDDIDLFALAESRKPIKVYPQISYPQYETQ